MQVLQSLAGKDGRKGTIQVPCATMTAWFDDLVTQLIIAMQGSLDRAKHNGFAVEYMLVVGGMASSAYLTAKLKDAFSHQVQDICYPSVLYQTVLTGELPINLSCPCTCYPPNLAT